MYRRFVSFKYNLIFISISLPFGEWPTKRPFGSQADLGKLLFEVVVDNILTALVGSLSMVVGRLRWEISGNSGVTGL